ncbi:MAG: hypothetical protein MJ090_00020 [Clostridia bacterium]|nr:hypothetical protein [Clostridia bacterium]
MKRIFCFLATLILTITVLSANVFAASTPVNNNLCKKFDKTVGNTISQYLVGNSVDMEHSKIYDGYGFARYVIDCLKKEIDLSQYKKKPDKQQALPITTYQIPYSVFFEKAKKIANFDGDFKKSYLYNKENDCIEMEMTDFIANMGHPVHVIGYNHISSDHYVVYAQAMQIEMNSVDEIKKEFAGYYDDDLTNHIFYCYDGKYHLVHEDYFFIADITYNNGNVFYNALKAVETLGDIEYIKKDDLVQESKVTVNAAQGIFISNTDAFPNGTTVYAKNIISGNIYNKAKTALSRINYENFLVYDFSAIKDNKTVQPQKTVLVEIKLPNDFSAKKIKMYYLTNDGKLEPVKITTDIKTKKSVAELEHFSTYIIVNNKNITSPKTGYKNEEIIFAIIGFVFCISLFSFCFYIRKSQIKYK